MNGTGRSAGRLAKAAGGVFGIGAAALAGIEAAALCIGTPFPQELLSAGRMALGAVAVSGAALAACMVQAFKAPSAGRMQEERQAAGNVRRQKEPIPRRKAAERPRYAVFLKRAEPDVPAFLRDGLPAAQDADGEGAAPSRGC